MSITAKQVYQFAYDRLKTPFINHLKNLVLHTSYYTNESDIISQAECIVKVESAIHYRSINYSALFTMLENTVGPADIHTRDTIIVIVNETIL